MPKVYGKRIILREYRKDDLSFIGEWVNNANITDMLSDIFLFPHTEKNTEAFLDRMLTPGNKETCGFVIADKDTEAFIGQIDLFEIDWKNRKAVMGIIIGREENHNKGYGKEAIQLLLDYGFNRLGLNKIELTVRAYNERGIHCYEQCGFKVEGILRDDFFIHGQYTDTVKMAILQREWFNRS